MTDAATRVLHLVGNSHIDPVWLWQWPEGYQEIRATFRSALDRMREYPEFIFSCDSAAYYEWVEEIDPEMFEEIRQRVTEGRWEIVGGWWVEPDCNIPGGESFVRQALVAQRYFLEKFGRIATVGYNVDPFGHNAMLPQLLRRSGMDSYVFMRPGPHELRLPSPVFWWQSPDGSRVLGYRLPHEYCSPHEDLGHHLDKTIAQLPAEWGEMMAFYGVGNHGGGPTRENLDSIRRLDGAGAMPRLLHSSPRRFFDTTIAADGDLPVFEAELQHHAVGCYSAHSGIKRWLRRAEHALGAAETWSTLSTIVAKRSYPSAEFARAWKQVLFNEFHDILGGTAIEPAYEDAHEQLGEATSIANRALNLGVQSISRLIELPAEPGAVDIVAFNPHPWPVRTPIELEYGGLDRTDALQDDEGSPVAVQAIQSYATMRPWRSRIVFEATLPALGYRAYRMARGARPAEAKRLWANETTLENDHLRLRLNLTTGRPESLVLRDAGADIAELLAENGSRAAVVGDTSDTWGHRKISYRDEIGAFAPSGIELVESGPVRAILRVTSAYGRSSLVEDYVLTAEGHALEVRAILDWREEARLLKLRYTTALEDPTAAFEIPYGVIERRASGDEEPAQRWLDVSGVVGGSDELFGLGIVNDAKYAVDVHGAEAGITCVRSPIFAHHEPTEPLPGVRYSYQDQGMQRFHLLLVPHRGTWSGAGLTRLAIEHNSRPTVLFEGSHRGPLPRVATYLAVSPENMVVGAMKVAEDGDDIVLRLVETAGHAAAVTVDAPILERRFSYETGPFEIRTFRVPRDSTLPVIESDLLERVLAT